MALENNKYESKTNLLIRNIQSGNKRAFEKLYRTYYSELCDFIYPYVESSAICEELVQDLFLSIWHMKETWNPKGTPKAYLYKGAKNRALDYLKHREVEIRYLKEQKIVLKNEHVTSIANSNHLPKKEGRSLDNKLVMKVEEAINNLPERGRLIFTLSREDGLTYREISYVLDISVKTVETQMGRTLKKLRDEFSDYLPGFSIICGCFQIFI